MAYTYGAGIQSSPNAAYNLWGSTGPTNPYIMQGGPSYTPNPIPPQAMPPQGGSLMPSVSGGSMSGIGGAGGDSRNSSYYSNKAGGDPKQAAKLALMAGDRHAAYMLDHLSQRQEAGVGWLEGLNPDFYKGMTMSGHPTETPLSIPSDRDTINSIPGALRTAAEFAVPALGLLTIGDKIDSVKKWISELTN